MIKVLYTRITEKLPATTFENLLNNLPKTMQNQVLKYRFWQDAQRSLLGKSLLKMGLDLGDYSSASLHTIEYTAYNKPFLQNGPFFNISHSGDWVVCAISKIIKLGIDIEEVKEIPLTDFSDLFSPDELEKIFKRKGDFIPFYTLWTQKEAYVKAIGRGLNMELRQVIVQQECINSENEIWFLTPLPICTGYICNLATNFQNPAVKMSEIFF